MSNPLPQRPNLDHLRRQAKSLLSSLVTDAAAVRTFQDHLPAASGMTADQVRSAGFRLADAQSAVARGTGFASWPALARHVDQLRSLEGTWRFDRLELDGARMPSAATARSRLLIDGDRFRTESPEGIYEGVFNIDVESRPHQIDIEFVAGPEAGNWNYGIFKIDGDRLEICLDITGQPRPASFSTAPNSGHAYEVLRRESGVRPRGVEGGSPAENRAAPAASPPTDVADFVFVPSETLTRLQGTWGAESIVLNGMELPGFMLKTAKRVAAENSVTITVGGVTVIEALVRIEGSACPVQIDYLNTGGNAKGTSQLGIMEWRDGSVCFCMGAPGGPRPVEFVSTPENGTTLSIWTKR